MSKDGYTGDLKGIKTIPDRYGHAVLFTTPEYLEEHKITYRVGYSGQTLRCLVVQPADWDRLNKYLELDYPSSHQHGHPVVRNTHEFRQHVIRQTWRLSEWQ